MNKKDFYSLSLTCRKRFAINLQLARMHCSFSQSVLAKMLGGTQSEISRWERGIVFPSLNKILILQHLLHADLLSGVVELYELEMTKKEHQH